MQQKQIVRYRPVAPLALSGVAARNVVSTGALERVFRADFGLTLQGARAMLEQACGPHARGPDIAQ